LILAFLFLSTGQNGMGCMYMRDSKKYYWWSGFWLAVALICFFCMEAFNDFYSCVGFFIIGFYCLIVFNMMMMYAGHLKKYHEGRWRKDI
jgi:hypothetical protein